MGFPDLQSESITAHGSLCLTRTWEDRLTDGLSDVHKISSVTSTESEIIFRGDTAFHWIMVYTQAA